MSFAQSIARTFGKSPASSRFVQFLGSNSRQFDSVNVAHCGSMGVGLVAARDIQVGELVVSVPPSIWQPLSADYARENLPSPVVQHVESQLAEFDNQDITSMYSSFILKNTIYLALTVLKEMNATVDAPITPFDPESPSNEFISSRPYLDLVAKSPLDVPLFWDNARLRELACTSVVADVQERRAFVGWLYSSIFEARPDLFGEYNVTQPNFAWALSLIMSRAISGIGNQFSFVPVIDFMNHSPEYLTTFKVPPGYCNLSFDRTSSHFLVKSLTNASAGQQLFINYGDIGNASLLRMYGFAVADNPYDSVQVSLEHHGKVHTATSTWHQPIPPKLVFSLRDSVGTMDDRVVCEEIRGAFQNKLATYQHPQASPDQPTERPWLDMCNTLKTGEAAVLQQAINICEAYLADGGTEDFVAYARAR